MKKCYREWLDAHGTRHGCNRALDHTERHKCPCGATAAPRVKVAPKIKTGGCGFEGCAIPAPHVHPIR